MKKSTQVITGLMILSLVLAAGCTPPATQPAVPPTPTLAPGWETYVSSEPCGYAINHPSSMDGASQDTYSWILNTPASEPSGPFPNFIYISVIPEDLQSSEGGIIYNYDQAETRTLLDMQVGESRSLREDPNVASSFKYTRLPDTVFGGQTAQTYENSQPWEFPPGTKELRYYLQGNGCTYLIGGYMATVGSGEVGAIGQELFDEIMATFRVNP